MLKTMRKGVVAALLGVTVGCGGNSAVGPTSAVVAPVAVAPAPAARAVLILTPSVSAVARGAELSVTWTVSSGGAGNDWIEFSRTTDTNFFYSWSRYTEGAQSGTFTLVAPNQAGQYEFRYLLDDGWIDAARSAVVTVF